MAKTKKDIETVEEVVVAPVSERRKAFMQLMENYKKQNPVKFELKKDELARKLAAIK